MLLLTTLLHCLLLQSTEGEDYCSSKLKDKVECIPCSQLCSGVREQCSNSTYVCPKQCGITIKASECPDVCKENCRNGSCEYTNGLKGLTCMGCEPEFTGRMCVELCPARCYECHQFNSTCITCRGNYRPPDCTEPYETTSAWSGSFYPTEDSISTMSGSFSPTEDSISTMSGSFSPSERSILATSSNCYDDCKSCNNISGDCTECPHGNYGSKCDKVCIHCNISICGMDTACLECISNMTSIECAAAWTEYITSTTVTDCTGPDCHQVSAKGTERRYTEEILALVCGILAALVMTFIVIFSWRKLVKRYRLKRAKDSSEHQENSDQGYAYINVDDLDPYYSGMNETRLRPQLRAISGHYDRLGYQDVHQDDNNSKSLSSNCETTFGNVLEVHIERHDSGRNNIIEKHPYLAKKKHYASANEYEMNISSYLTPELTATRPRSGTL